MHNAAMQHDGWIVKVGGKKEIKITECLFTLGWRVDKIWSWTECCSTISCLEGEYIEPFTCQE